jgi:hypothetical protein
MPEIISRAVAREAGLKRYFTGEPCKHGHISEWQTSSGKCMTCKKKGQIRSDAKDPNKRTKSREYTRRKMQQDPSFRLVSLLRCRVKRAIKRAWKSGPTLELLGCTIDQLWDHLEHQFQPGMTRENHGSVWHIDHAKPCASFDLTAPAQQRECFGFMNLQPLFTADNLNKRAKPETDEQFVARMLRFFEPLATHG